MGQQKPHLQGSPRDGGAALGKQIAPSLPGDEAVADGMLAAAKPE